MRDYLIVGALLLTGFLAAMKLSDMASPRASGAHAETVNLKLHGTHISRHPGHHTGHI